MKKEIQLKRLAATATIAAATNLTIYLVGYLAGADYQVNAGVSMQVQWFMVALATFSPLMIAGVVTKAISAKRSGFQTFASWAGLTVATLSIASVFTAAQDTATIVALALMHVVGGSAWFIATKK